MLNQYFIYNVGSKCVFESGNVDWIWLFIHAKDEFNAMRIAHDHLLSGKSGFKVKAIDWQELGGSNRFIAEDEQISPYFPYV